MKTTPGLRTEKPGRLSVKLAMAAVALLLNACSTHQMEFALPGSQPVTLSRGLNDEASEHFWSGVRPLSNLSHAHYKLGRYYQRGGKHEEAIEEFIKALELDETFVLAYNGLGVSYDALKDCDNAEKAYAKALQYSPNQAYLHNNLGCSRLICNDPQQAVVHLAKAAELDAAIPKIQNNLKLAELRFQQRYPEKQGMFGLTAPIQPPEQRVADAGSALPQVNPPMEAPPAMHTGATTVKDEPAPAPAAMEAADTPAKVERTPSPVPVADQQVAETIEAVKDVAREETAITIQPMVRIDLPNSRKQSVKGVPHNPAGCPVEIANGNGVTGMASRGADFLRKHGYTVNRVLNAPNFNYSKSTIFFQDGFQQNARALADILPGPQSIEPLPSSQKAGSGIRLIVGKDMATVRFPEMVAHIKDGTTSKVVPEIAQLN